MKKTAIYLQIAQNIIEMIQDGTLHPGDQLMTESQLCEKYNVSRMTVNKALSTLVAQNYINRIPGKGSFVLEANVLKNIDESVPSSFSRDILSINKKPGAILVEYRVVYAKEIPDAARQLLLSDNELVHFIHRIRTIDDMRVALSYTYIPCKYLPALDVTILEQSLYRYLDEEYNIHPSATDYTFKALLPTKKQQALLLTESCALLKVSHTSVIDNGSLFEYTETYYAGNQYTYHFSKK